MARDTTAFGAAAILAVAALLLSSGRAAAADEAAADGIVPPSEYVEKIEAPADTGGFDASTVRAEAAKIVAPAQPVSPGQRAAAIATDVIIGRPTLLMATVAGSAFFALSLPITAFSGGYEEALDRFVKDPGQRLIGPLGE